MSALVFYISTNHVSMKSFSESPLKTDNWGHYLINETFTRVIYKCSHCFRV